MLGIVFSNNNISGGWDIGGIGHRARRQKRNIFGVLQIKKKRGVSCVFDSGVFAICILVKHENIYFS